MFLSFALSILNVTSRHLRGFSWPEDQRGSLANAKALYSNSFKCKEVCVLKAVVVGSSRQRFYNGSPVHHHSLTTVLYLDVMV